ncbi:Long-chain-alcohol oxidase FAO1 [Lecanosticta acicola]|uniref:Long-chain-alcohol oxidase n=1 Tax=Lecanosticta acicola TaxID=111012 RepID=A0AAI9E798_9PEZI|nr:Long-chain-alcohol oxidase FAO1 [Lecanosticta acicola]
MSAILDSATASLPPGPEQDPFTPAQLAILCAIADTVVPPLIARSSGFKGNKLLQHPLRDEVYDGAARRIQHLARLDSSNQDLATSYLQESATAEPEFKDSLQRLVAFYMSDASKKGLLFILSALSTRAGSLLLTGYATPLDGLPIQDREQVLLGWARSRLPLLRGLSKSLAALVRILWLRTSPTVGRILGYPRLPTNAVNPGPGYPFRFVQIPPAPAAEPEVIETDVVIVGSGCGAAVVAKTIAESGLRVLVVEKQYYWPPEYLPMSENAAGTHLFGNGGGHMSEDASIMVLPGSTWGGGGTVNWSASLQPQGLLRREWAEKFGLTHFMGSDFQADLDAVWDRMGVSYTSVEHNKGNQVLMEGARKMGWSAKPVPQNTGGEVHSDGYCTRGCRDCGKKGPTVTWLPDAAEAGANFIEGFDVKEILFGESGLLEDKPAIGVKGTWTSRDSSGGVSGPDRTVREVIVKARKTVVAGGSLYSPILLQRSGLKNKHIGRHLHLHPVSMLAAVWDEDVRPWEGPILTSVVNEFENMDGEGYGVKLEATTMIAGSFLPVFQWQGGLHWKEFTSKMRRMTGYISLARDRYGGQVSPDSDGKCLIHYTPSKYDKNHILEGVVRLAEIMYVEGAREIHTAIAGLEPFIRPSEEPNITIHNNPSPSVTDSLFQAWIQKIRTTGFPDPGSVFASAHQMGSCRMGTSSKNSAVDFKGRVWGTKGLYVADTSVFPSASGVNPMITCMGVARNIARGIVDEEGASGAGAVRARL